MLLPFRSIQRFPVSDRLNLYVLFAFLNLPFVGIDNHISIFKSHFYCLIMIDYSVSGSVSDVDNTVYLRFTRF